MRFILCLPILFVVGCASLQRTDRYLPVGDKAAMASDDESFCVELENKGLKYELNPLRASHFVAIGIPIIPLIPTPISHKNFVVRVTPLSKADSSKIHPQEWALRIGSEVVKPSIVRAQAGRFEGNELDLSGGGMEVTLFFPEQKESFDRATLVTEWKDRAGKKIEVEFAHKFGPLEYHPFSVMSYQQKCSVSKI